MNYDQFLKGKKRKIGEKGRNIEVSEIHPMLFDFQKAVTQWAVKKGCAALFLDTGLGKTFCQLEWARLIGEPCLIVAPLSVARQTVREAKKIDIEVRYIRDRTEIDPQTQIHITNYEMIDRVLDPRWRAIVLDESSILKSFDGKTRLKLIKLFQDVPFRLACTATPAPNDQVELGNHTEFLGVCKQTEMLSEFFIHANLVKERVMGNGMIVREKQSNKKGQEWRLKNYAKDDFYRWLSSWAMSMKKPSDLGFDDDGFILPPLNINPVFVSATYKPEGKLFFDTLKGIQERGKVRHETIKPKIEKALEIILDSVGPSLYELQPGDRQVQGQSILINGSNRIPQWVIWCGLNEEQDRLYDKLTSLGFSVSSVFGSLPPEKKQQRIEDWLDGKTSILLTKGKVCGYGLNFQNAHNMLFLGLSDSWEAYYQCIRREWRFGQKEPVNVWIVLSDVERAIYENVLRKEQIAKSLHDEMMKTVARHEKRELGVDSSIDIEYNPLIDFTLPKWIGGQNEDNLQMRDLRERSNQDKDTWKPEKSSKILQSEMQRNCQTQSQEGTNPQCRVSLSELRESGSNLSESIGEVKLCPEVLQFEMSRLVATRGQKSSMDRRATLPEWLRGDISS